MHGEGEDDTLNPYTVGYSIAEELLTQRGISRLANRLGAIAMTRIPRLPRLRARVALGLELRAL